MTRIQRHFRKFTPSLISNFYRKVLAGNNPPLKRFFETTEALNPLLVTGELAQIFSEHQGLKLIKWAHFIEIYESILSPFKQTALISNLPEDQVRLLEIGVHKGGSLEVWKKYFGSTATIIGVDIDPKCANLDIPGVNVRIGSQVDQNFLREIVNEIGSLNIIIDDGSHNANHVSKTLEYLWPYLSEGGIYVIEDTHTSYWKEYNGGFKKSQSIIEFMKDAVDTLHQTYTRKSMPKRTDFLKDSVFSIEFFDSIIVLRKKSAQKPELLTIGNEG